MSEDKELAALEKEIEAKQKEESAAKDPEEKPKESESQPVQSNEPDPTPKSQEFDASEWVKKKGWTKPEDAAKSIRELERQFHEKNQELRELKEKQAYQPPPNPYGGYQSPPPVYAPPQNPYGGYQSPVSEERIAASYGLSVEDFRKVMQVSRDVAEIQSRQIAQDYQRWKAEQESQYAKSADMAEVMGDPAFHVPDVQKEVHEILEKNPNMFTESRPYSRALKEALVNIGRRNMTRGYNPGSSLPSEPPRMAGSGAANGSAPLRRNSTGLPTTKDAERMSPEELEKALKGANAFKTYADMA